MERSLSIIENVGRKTVSVRSQGIRAMITSTYGISSFKGKNYAKSLKLGPEMRKYGYSM